MLFVRFCCALVSASIVTISIPRLAFELFWSMRCSDYWTTTCEEVFDWFNQLTPLLIVFVATLWIGTWAYFEIMAYRQSTREKPRLLTHLRYGPIAVLLLSIIAVVSFDNVMIQYSRRQIVHYIHSNASPWLPPDLNVYNDYHGFCAFGMSLDIYARYAETAAEYFDDPDPWVRARAIQVGLHLYPGNKTSSDVMKKAMADENLLVRQIAAEYQSELWATP